MSRFVTLVARSMRYDRRFVVPVIFALTAAVGIGLPALTSSPGIPSIRESGATVPWGAFLTPPSTVQQAGLDSMMRLLVGVALAALVVAAFTVISLNWSRSIARREAWSTHRAVGASRRQLLWTGLLEGATILFGAAVPGLILGVVARGVVTAAWPGPLAIVPPPGVAIWALIAMATIVFLGALAPYRLAHRRMNLAAPKPSGNGLVMPIVQFGVCVALLLGAVELVERSRVEGAMMNEAAPGDVVQISARTGLTHQQQADTFASLLDTLTRQPEILAAALVSPGAITGIGTGDLAIADCGNCSLGGIANPFPPVPATYHVVSPDSFEALGLSLAVGRDFTASDGQATDPVAIVSRSMAERFFEDGRALGRHVAVGGTEGVWHEVVGVVEDRSSPALGGSRQSPHAVYLSLYQYPAEQLDLLVRAPDGGDPTAVVMDTITRGFGNRLVAGPSTTLRELIRRDTAPLEWFGVVFGAEAAAAFLIAAFGVFIAIDLTVSRRMPEFGLRRATGARKIDILKIVFGQAAMVMGLGAVVGLWLNLMMKAGLSLALDGPVTVERAAVVTVLVALATAAFAGAALPARRAVSRGPAAALQDPAT